MEGRKKRQAERRADGTFGNCFNCNEPSHIARDCTAPRAGGDRGGGRGAGRGGAGGGRGGGRGNRDGPARGRNDNERDEGAGDEEKTAFITPEGCFCYICMPFGLRNAGATFQRAMRECLCSQMGRNVEAYMDDIVVKTRDQCTFIEDLRETFNNLCKVHLMLNPEKCTFGVPSGKLLGFLVSHRGIEANPDKIKAIEEI